MENSANFSEDRYLRSGDESFNLQGNSVGYTLGDYWQWAGSDLLNNRERGIIAEFIVATAFGVTNTPRLEWGWYDVVTKKGKKIEVKSAAYYQSWPQEKPSNIQFDIAPRKEFWDPNSNETRTEEIPTRLSDAYVFCLLGSLDEPNPNPLSIGQWTFYVIDTYSLNRVKPVQQKIGLRPLRNLVEQTTGRRDVEYGDLCCVTNQLISPR